MTAARSRAAAPRLPAASPGVAAGTRRLLLGTIFYVNLLSLGAQVVWVRRASVLFGSTAFVLASILGLFLLGLAAGSAWGGRRSTRGEESPRRLAALVAALAAAVALSLPLFALGHALLAHLPAAGGGSPLPSAAARLVAVALGVLPATFLIGALLPLVAQLEAQARASAGRSYTLVYALDTLGGASGALLAGFVLVPGLGLSGSMALLSSGAALVALALWWRGGSGAPMALAPAARAEAGPDAAQAATAHRPARGTLLALAAFALSGCAALWLETGWSRFFYVLNGTSVHSLAVVLAGFLAGIGLGSLLVRRRVERVADLAMSIAVLQIVIALGGIAVFRARPLFERYFLWTFAASPGEFVFHASVFFAIFLMVLAATLAMGANFPLVARWLADRAPAGATRGAGSALARAFVVNTLGAVAGAFSGEFLLLPAGGFSGLLLAVVLFYLGSAAIFFFLAPAPQRRRSAWRVAVLAAAALAMSPPWFPLEPPKSAVYYHGVRDKTYAQFSEANRQMRSVWRRQGFYGQVEVLATPVDASFTALFLKHNGKTDATNLPGDAYAQTLLGQLPVFFHARPERVLNIGLGGGLTLAAIARHPGVREMVQVEIDPLVAEAARRHFAAANRGALDDRRVSLVIDDGRHFLDREGPRFDVIVSEPPNIWVAGVSGLFTREFYAAAARRLADDGILSQWFPVHELSAEDLRTGLRTLSLEFPHGAVWTNGYDAIVLASRRPLDFDPRRFAERLATPGVAADFAEVGYRGDAVLAFLRRPRFRVDEFLAAAPGSELNTDDRPVLEFRTARNLYRLGKDERKRLWLAGR